MNYVGFNVEYYGCLFLRKSISATLESIILLASQISNKSNQNQTTPLTFSMTSSTIISNTSTKRDWPVTEIVKKTSV